MMSNLGGEQSLNVGTQLTSFCTLTSSHPAERRLPPGLSAVEIPSSLRPIGGGASVAKCYFVITIYDKRC